MDRIVFSGARDHHKKIKNHTLSVRDFAAFTVVHRAIKHAGGSPYIIHDPEHDTLSTHPAPAEKLPKFDLPIGIVGAGATALYAAMILDDLGIDYEILEAQERIGGRLWTHRFNGEAGRLAPVGDPARYDYFDVGAMRYPEIPFMTRVFDLFRNRLQMEDLLIPYYLSNDNTYKSFNNRPPATSTQANEVFDYFHVSVANGGTVPDDYVREGVDHWTGKAYDYYKDLFGQLDFETDIRKRQEIFQRAWDELVKQDHFSTRGYMLAGPEGKPPGSAANYPNSVVDWLETFDSATGLYDQAFTESVLDALDFGWPDPARVHLPIWPPKPTEEWEWKWWCIDGGSDHIVSRMVERIKKKPEVNKRVTRIHEMGNAMVVKVAGEAGTRVYSQVICTAPLGCLQTIDTSSCNLLYSQRMAMRQLHYDASTKIGLKFEKRWWQDPKVMGTGTIQGGSSSTDLPIRTCVYPSYGLNVPNPPGVLLASYTWAQDALRIGSLAQGKGTPADALLLEATLDDVARLNKVTREQMGPVLGHFAHNFYIDANARGAFTLLGPGQFGKQETDPAPGTPPTKESLFTSMKAPAASGKLHFANEATSVHHAWVLGSLNSAWRAVYNALEGREELREKLKLNWGIPDEETEIHLRLLNALARDHKI